MDNPQAGNLLDAPAESADLGTTLGTLTRYSFAPDLLAQFHGYLAEANPIEQYMIRPEDVAARLSLDEGRVLELLVAAVHEGLLELHWEVLCPQCTGATTSWATLGEATHESYCDYCSKTFPVHADGDMRVRFSLHPRFGTTHPPRPDFQLHRSDESYVSGLDLLNLQAFRDLLRQNLLPPDENLRVSRVAILFTDLRGSTALYAMKGDPYAYRLVRDHFSVLFAATHGQRGAVVKTIGDSIMAAFTSSAAAMRAGLEMQRAIAAFNRRQGLQAPEALLLKVGIHAGPCLAVMMNGIMDYFGSAANIASRIEGLSQGQDLLFTSAIMSDSAVPPLVADVTGRGGSLISFSTSVRGLPDPVAVHRLILPPPTAQEA